MKKILNIIGMLVIINFLLGNGLAYAGKIVVTTDEWTLRNTGFANAPDAATFALNVATWFTGGTTGKFLVYSTNAGLTESNLANTMTGAGHEWVINYELTFDLQTLMSYDAVFLTGTAVDNNVLIDYVNCGGNVYLAGGTTSNVSAEAARWNPFLNAFGLKYAPQHTGVLGTRSISSNHPIFTNVNSLYHYWGINVVDIDSNDTAGQVLVTSSGYGLYAAYESMSSLLDITSLSGTDSTINPLPLAGQGADISAILTSTCTNAPWQLSVDGKLIGEGTGANAQVSWDGKNKDGKIEPGIYNVVLTASTDDNSLTATKNMLAEVDWNDNCKLDIRFSNSCDSPSIDGLVAFYPFDGSANDESGNANHGTVYGGVTLTEDRFGNPDSAYSFDGYDDRIGVPNNASLQPEHMSIAIWFNSDPLYGNTSSYLDSALLLQNLNYLGGGTHHGYHLALRHLTGKINFSLNNSDYLNPVTDMQDREWNFVVGTYDGTHMKLYLNGVLVDSILHTAGYTPSNLSEFTIGSAAYSFNHYQHHYSGKIDDFRMYSRALTEEEILLLYSGGCQF